MEKVKSGCFCFKVFLNLVDVIKVIKTTFSFYVVSNKMSNNLRHILLLWIVPIAVIIALVVGIINKPQSEVIYYIPGFVIAIGLYLYIRMRTEGKVAKKFRQPNVNEVLRYYDNTIKSHALMPEANFIKSCSKSLALSMYGEFHDALFELNRYDISRKADLYNAMQLSGIALNKYLQKLDLENALKNAERALELSKLPGLIPGQKKAQNSYETYVEIGQVLNGLSSDATIASLERRFTKSTFLLKLIIAWALGVYYKSHGNKTREKEMSQFIQENAPYCEPLMNFN